mgnify:CR=1 FL=1
MNKRISVKTRVLIILLAIFVFLVAALSVSICMFVKADNVAAQAERLERVVRETDSLGEVLKASDGDTKAGAELLPEHRGAEVSENSITLYYTEKFEPSSKSDYKYRVPILLTPGKDGRSAGLRKREKRRFTRWSLKASRSRSVRKKWPAQNQSEENNHRKTGSY